MANRKSRPVSLPGWSKAVEDLVASGENVMSPRIQAVQVRSGVSGLGACCMLFVVMQLFTVTFCRRFHTCPAIMHHLLCTRCNLKGVLHSLTVSVSVTAQGCFNRFLAICSTQTLLVPVVNRFDRAKVLRTCLPWPLAFLLEC